MQMLTGIALDNGPDSLQERYYPESKKRFSRLSTMLEWKSKSGPGNHSGTYVGLFGLDER